MVAGRDAKFHGEAKNSWLTGTAAWTFVNISQYILGVYPTHTGLSINPCVPKGAPVDGCIIPYVKGKETYDVVVTMG